MGGHQDGPAYITQCPIKTGNSYTYNMTITGQRGTLWWHAQIGLLQAHYFNTKGMFTTDFPDRPPTPFN